MIIQDMRYYRMLFAWLIFVCCGDTAPKNKTDNPVLSQKEVSYSKPPSGNKDTLKIEGSAAVFYFPDSSQLEKIRNVTDPRVYDGSMHEYEYLVRNAKKIIHEYMPHLAVIKSGKARYILFKRTEKGVACIDLDNYNDSYGLFFTKPDRLPRLVDMANIEKELPAYFSR